MKKRFLSLLLVLVIAVSAIVATVVITNASTDGYVGTRATLAENITLKVDFSLPGCYEAKVKIGDSEEINVTDFITAKTSVTVPIDIAVKDLYQPITVTVTDGFTTYTKNTLEDSTEPFTAAAYLTALVENTDYAVYKNILTALLAYADVAEDYFAGVPLSAPANPFADNYAPTYGVVAGSTASVGITSHSVSLILESETIIRHYFTLDSGRAIDSYTFKTGDDVLTPAPAPDGTEGKYYVDIEGITPKELDTPFVISVSDGSNEYSYKYSALDYAYRAFSGDNNARKAIAAKLYLYSVEAENLPNIITYETYGFKPAGTYTTQFNNSDSVTLPDEVGVFTADGKSTDTATGNSAIGKYAIFGGWYFDPEFTEPATEETVEAMSEYVKLYAKLTVEDYSMNESARTYSPKYTSASGPSVHGAALAGSSGYLTLSMTVPADQNLDTAAFWFRSLTPFADSSVSLYILEVNKGNIYAPDELDAKRDTLIAEYDGSELKIDIIMHYELNDEGKFTGKVSVNYYVNGEIQSINNTATISTISGRSATEFVYSDSATSQRHIQAFAYSETSGDTAKFTGIYDISLYTGNIHADMDSSYGGILVEKIKSDIEAKENSFAASGDLSAWNTAVKDFPTSYTQYLTKSETNEKIEPDASHPRVWVNSTTLPSVAARIKSAENKAVFESVKAKADAALEESGGVTDTTTKFSTSAVEKIEALAFMYLVTGEEKYGYAAILHSFNYIDTQKFSDNSYTNSNNAGIAMTILSEVYDWCYDLFTPAQRTYFINGVCNNIGNYFEIGYPPNEDAGGISGHDAETGILRNWLIFGIAVYDENPEIYNFTAGKIIKDYVPAADFFYASGAHHQGSGYGTSPRLYSNIVSQQLMLAATGEDIYDADLGVVVMTHINRIRPDNEAIRIGDDFNQKGTEYNLNNGLMQVTFFAGSVYKNPVAKAWFEDSDFTKSYYGQAEVTPVTYLLFNDPTVRTADKYDLELVHYNPAPSGSVVTRSAWGDADAWLTYTNIKCAYEGNHDHRDAGTFQIYYKGILAPDSAAYEYSSDMGYNSSYDHAYSKQTVSKNGLLIYNPQKTNQGNWIYSGGQTLNDRNTNGDYGNDNLDVWQDKVSSNQAAVLGYSSKVNTVDGKDELVYTYISGDITRAYDEETVDLVMRSTMTLATGDSKNPMAFIVYDKIISDSASFEKSFVLHTTNKPVFGNGFTEADATSPLGKDWTGFKKVTGTNTFYYDNTLGADGAYAQDDPNDKYNGQLTVQTLLPASPAYYYVGGDGYRFWLDGQNYGTENTSGRPVAEIGWGRVEIAPSTQQKDDSFLNVMYVGDAGTMVAEQAKLVQGSTHEGAVTYGSCVMFSTTNTAIKSMVSFSTLDATDKESLTYYVGGLAEGTWTVSVGGETQTVEVTKEGTIAVFEAPAGAVTLTPGDLKKSEINYNLQDGAFVDGYTVPEEATEGSYVTLPTAADITRNGYDFGGWYDNADCTGTALTTVTYTEGGTTLYAKWTLKTASINYVLCGGHFAGEYESEVSSLEDVTLTANIEYEGYRFLGWYDNETCTGEAITSVNYADAQDGVITVYAKWEKTPSTNVGGEDSGIQLPSIKI